MIRDSAELGLEMFHIDAGWFRGVGDWYPDPKKFPHGLAPIADEAHQQRLKFGIWVDWTQAALDTEPGALNAHDPKSARLDGGRLPPDWKPERSKDRPSTSECPRRKTSAQSEVKRIVEDYHLDMLEHDGYLVAQGCARTDHPHAPPDRANWIRDARGRQRFRVDEFKLHRCELSRGPRLLRHLFAAAQAASRICCSKSATMAGAWWTSAAPRMGTTSRSPIPTIRSRTGAPSTTRATCLPPAMLESYVEKWPTPQHRELPLHAAQRHDGLADHHARYDAWTPEQHAAAKQEFAALQGRAASVHSRCRSLPRFAASGWRALGRHRVLRPKPGGCLRVPRLNGN